MKELKCKCGSKRFSAVKNLDLIDLIDEKGNVLDSNYSQIADMWGLEQYDQIRCIECGEVIKVKGAQ